MVVDGGDNGGYVTSSHLQLTVSSQHHNALITCEATNKIVKKRVHKDITLSVKRKFSIMRFNAFDYQIKFHC